MTDNRERVLLSRELRCSTASNTIDTRTTISNRVLSEGPVANNSFITKPQKIFGTLTKNKLLQVFSNSIQRIQKKIGCLNFHVDAGLVLFHVYYSKEKADKPFSSNISKTMPPPLATHVSGSSAQ